MKRLEVVAFLANFFHKKDDINLEINDTYQKNIVKELIQNELKSKTKLLTLSNSSA